MNEPKPALWDVSRPQPYALNAKVHDNAQVEKIATSIKQFGWRGNPIVVDENEVILAGHGRRLAALQLGLKQVPVVQVTDMTEQQKKAYRLADNRVAISQLDTELFKQELATMQVESLDGIFDAKELAFLDADLGELNTDAFVADLDEAIAEQANETTRQIAAAAEKDVPVAKALGFKTIKGADERAVAIFMAQIEEDTGKQGAEAFIEFINTFAGASA